MTFHEDLLLKLSNPSTRGDENESDVLKPFTYLETNPGKDIIVRIIEALNAWMLVPKETCSRIAKAVDRLKTASLMVDDVQDSSELRRGKPAAHTIFGIPQTINAANYVYFIAFRELMSIESPHLSSLELFTLVNDEVLALHRGQGLDILWRDSLVCPTEEEYIRMVSDKTGGLLRLCVKLMMACATKNIGIDYVPLINMLAVFYQIRDDLMNITSADYTKRKGFAEDLSEGKFSFPIIHAIQSEPEDSTVIDVLAARPQTPTRKLRVLAHFTSTSGSIRYTVEALGSLRKQILAEIERLGGNSALSAIVVALTFDPAVSLKVDGVAQS